MFSMVIQLAQSQPGNGTSGLLSMIIPFALIFVLFYFLMIRPQSKKEKERLNMLGSLRKDDRVLTSGGIYGIVTNIKENEVTLKVDEESNIKIRLARHAIVGIIKRAEE
jgi:preprotein translocase subunit YajC